MFAAGDEPSLAYAASRLGKLMDVPELREAFARSMRSQLLLMEGAPPAAAMRLDHSDVALIRRRIEEANMRDSGIQVR